MTESEEPRSPQPPISDTTVPPAAATEPAHAHSGEQPPSPGAAQRTRLVIGGLVAIAIIALLAIAVFGTGGDNDDDDADEVVPTTEAAQQGDQGETNAGASEGEGEEGAAVDESGPELGSLSITAYLCPAPSSPQEDCLAGGPVDILDATIRLEDGTMMTLEGEEPLPDGSYAWLNVPIGEYVLLEQGLLGPGGTGGREVVGAESETDEGWIVSNRDPNQPAVLQILFAPEEGEAAG
jgi:hypothetical protein